MRPTRQSTAISSTPAIKETRVNKIASSGSMNSERNGTRVCSGSISESENLVCEISIPSDRSATLPHEEKGANDLNQDHAIRRHKSSDIFKREKDRESVINLAKFLRTTDPPPNNYMSLSETGQQIQDKKLPFKMLRRQTSQKSSNAMIRTLRLPDSAVAAKTSQGHWHIAISIPVEYDHQEPNTPFRTHTAKHTKAQSETALRDGPITVLKPVIRNVRPAALDKLHFKSHSHDDLRRPLSGFPIPDAEAGSTLPAYHDRKVNQDIPQTLITDLLPSSQPSDGDNTISIPDSVRPESQRSNARNSQETNFTIRSLEFNACHTRGQSSISTAPSVTYPTSPRSIASPEKQPSGSNHITHLSEHSRAVQLSLSTVNVCAYESLRPISVGSEISSANLKIAGTAQGYGPSDMAGTQVVFFRKGTQTPSSAPDTNHPDLPKNISRAQPASRPPKNTSAEYILKSQSTISSDYSATPLNVIDGRSIAKARQSRRERVKAIRSKDMAKLRAVEKCQQVITSVARKEIPSSQGLSAATEARVEPYCRRVQKRSLSYTTIAEETAWQKALNSLTPIMVVGDLEPSTASSDLCVPVFSRFAEKFHEKERRVGSRNSPGIAQTPPRSIPPSPVLSDAERMSMRNSLDKAQTPPRSVPRSPGSSGAKELRPWPGGNSASHSEGHQKIRQDQDNLRGQKSMPDESMDIRMRRLETINAVIFRTLNAVVEMGVSFGELRKVLPAELIRSQEAQLRIESASQAEDILDPIGSLIQDLQGAVKVGKEELAKYGVVV